jgi:hypothetical protein
MEKEEKDSFKDFWTRAHMGVVVFNPYEEHHRPKSEEVSIVHKESSHKDEGYQVFKDGGIFGNGPVCDAVMFSILF